MLWMFSAPTPVNRTVEVFRDLGEDHRGNGRVRRTQTARSAARRDPSHWITLALVFAAGLYFVLFALGATAYRTLYLNK